MKRIFILFLLLVTGCASNNNNSLNEEAKFPTINAQYALFGKLEFIGNKYIFTQFSYKYDKKKPWVRLNDLKPMWSIPSEKCFGTSQENDCKTPNDPELFIEAITKLESQDYVLGTLFAPFMAISAASQLEYSRTLQVTLDTEKYNLALTSAIKELNASSKYGNYLVELSEFDSHISQNFIEFDELKDGYKVSSSPTISVNDKTNLFTGKPSYFNSVVSIDKNSLENFYRTPKKDNNLFGYIKEITEISNYSIAKSKLNFLM